MPGGGEQATMSIPASILMPMWAPASSTIRILLGNCRIFWWPRVQGLALYHYEPHDHLRWADDALWSRRYRVHHPRIRG